MSESKWVGYGKKLRELILHCGLSTNYPLTFYGCTDDEVELIRQGQKVDFLPEVYRQFLKEMGKDAGPLFVGSTLGLLQSRVNRPTR